MREFLVLGGMLTPMVLMYFLGRDHGWRESQAVIEELNRSKAKKIAENAKLRQSLHRVMFERSLQ